MQYTDPSPITVNFISVAGWDSPGTVIINYGELLHFVSRTITVSGCLTGGRSKVEVRGKEIV